MTQDSNDKFLAIVAQEVNPESQGLPWLPLPAESASDYIAFELWRDLGTKRPRQAHRLAIANAWEARALSYDDYLARQPQDLQAKAQELSRSILGSSAMVLHCLQLELVKIARSMGTTSSPSLTLPEVLKGLETVAKVSRLLTDQSTENIAVIGKFNLSLLTDEELAQYEVLTKKAEIET